MISHMIASHKQLYEDRVHATRTVVYGSCTRTHSTGSPIFFWLGHCCFWNFIGRAVFSTSSVFIESCHSLGTPGPGISDNMIASPCATHCCGMVSARLSARSSGMYLFLIPACNKKPGFLLLWLQAVKSSRYHAARCARRFDAPPPVPSRKCLMKLSRYLCWTLFALFELRLTKLHTFDSESKTFDDDWLKADTTVHLLTLFGWTIPSGVAIRSYGDTSLLGRWPE